MNLEWLRKQAKRLLAQMRQTNPAAKLADAQLALARQHGFSSWRALRAHADTLTIDGQLFDAARTGDLATLSHLLDQYPDKLQARNPPYAWTLLHTAASEGQLEIVDSLLRRGLDVNTREQGDNTYAMHWAAAAGRVDIVRRLADAGGDVIGKGDDHEMEVIGWATCWDGTDDAAHRAVVEFLLSRGARHVIFNDRSKDAIRMVKKNLELCGVDEGYVVREQDVFSLLRSLKPPLPDFVFFDPPYDFARYVKLLEKMMAFGVTTPEMLIILETFKKTTFQPPQEFEVVREVLSGDSRLTFVRLKPASDRSDRSV